MNLFKKEFIQKHKKVLIISVSTLICLGVAFGIYYRIRMNSLIKDLIEQGAFVERTSLQLAGSLGVSYDLKFHSVGLCLGLIQSAEKKYFEHNQQYIDPDSLSNFFSEVLSEKPDIEANPYTLNLSEQFSSKMVNTMHTLFSNTNSDFSLNYSLSENRKQYTLRLQELTDCNYDGDSKDYFYIKSSDSKLDILFKDKGKRTELRKFRLAYFSKLSTEILEQKLKGEF